MRRLGRGRAVHLAPMAAVSAHEALHHLSGVFLTVELPTEHVAGFRVTSPGNDMPANLTSKPHVTPSEPAPDAVPPARYQLPSHPVIVQAF